MNLVAIVFNDNAFGDVRRMSKDDSGNRLVACDLRNLGFVKLAERYGMTRSATWD